MNDMTIFLLLSGLRPTACKTQNGEPATPTSRRFLILFLFYYYFFFFDAVHLKKQSGTESGQESDSQKASPRSWCDSLKSFFFFGGSSALHQLCLTPSIKEDV